MGIIWNDCLGFIYGPSLAFSLSQAWLESGSFSSSNSKNLKVLQDMVEAGYTEPVAFLLKFLAKGGGAAPSVKLRQPPPRTCTSGL